MLKKAEYLEKAEELEKEGKLLAAIQLLEECKENYPEYVLGRLLLGKYYYKLEDLDKAEVELKFVVKEAPDSIMAFMLLGEIAEKKGNYEEAREHFIRVKFLNPFNSEIDEKLISLEKRIKEQRAESAESALLEEKPLIEIPEEEKELLPTEELPEVFATNEEKMRGEEFSEKSVEEAPTLPEVFPEFEETAVEESSPEIPSIESETPPPDSQAFLSGPETPSLKEEKDLFETPTMAEILAAQGEGEEAEKILLRLYEKTGESRYLQKLKKVKLMRKLNKFLEVIENRK